MLNAYIRKAKKEEQIRDFPGGPVVKNPPSNTLDTGLIPGWGTKIPHATGQLSPCAATTEPTRSRAREPQLESSHAATTEHACSDACTPQVERSLHAVMKSLRAATKDPVRQNEDLTCRN